VAPAHGFALIVFICNRDAGSAEAFRAIDLQCVNLTPLYHSPQSFTFATAQPLHLRASIQRSDFIS
jgi:hypothetical protein